MFPSVIHYLLRPSNELCCGVFADIIINDGARGWKAVGSELICCNFRFGFSFEFLFPDFIIRLRKNVDIPQASSCHDAFALLASVASRRQKLQTAIKPRVG